MTSDKSIRLFAETLKEGRLSNIEEKVRKNRHVGEFSEIAIPSVSRALLCGSTEQL